EKMSRYLLENYRDLRPAFGSHNVRSISHALACADQLGVPQGAYEFQMLYGMADPIKDVLVNMGHRLRIYTPYGQLLPGMAYLVRRLLENTSNESFLRASFTDQRPEDQLLMNPMNLAAGHNGQAGAPHRAVGEVSPGRFRNEPPTDFAREENRDATAARLTAVSGHLH